MSRSEHHNDDPLAGAPEVASGGAGKPEYRVGYKRPPLHSRFKPGQSGNPKGRPTGRPNAKTTVERVMNERVAVREGEKTRHMSKFEAMMQAQALKGMKGDARSAGMVINVMTRAGLLGDPDTETGIAGFQRDTPAAGLRLGDALFENLDPSELSNDEMIELSRLAEVIDLGGDVTALSTGDFERLKQIINKGRGKDITAPNGEHYE